MARSSSSASAPVDAELLLPRPPGVIRQFWARHPRFTDIVVTLVGLAIALTTAGPVGTDGADPGAPVHIVSMVIAIAAAATLMLRRRWPLVPYALAILLQLVMLAYPSAAGSPLLVLSMYAVAVYGSSRLCWIAYGAGMGAIAVVGGFETLLGTVDFLGALNALLSAAVVALVGALVGINIGNRKRYLEAVIDRSRQLLVERDQQAQLAAADERARIAREMHDVVSHSLTVIVALSEGAIATPDIERARGAMDAAATTAREALTEMRVMLGVLRDGDVDAPLAPLAPVSPFDVVAAAQRAGYPATLVVTGAAELPETAQYAIGRIVQEGVTNAMRHAPSATAIRVLIDHAATATTVTVRNDRAQPSSGPGGFGLRGIAERTAHIGGTLSAGPDGAGGWELSATIPAPPSGVDADAPGPREDAS
ncbi:sensor histidine kinase [Microbacterium kyungheense]|uniref:sensor histidine kinase n=1 Tax=Microbacterium kyungheense TaxID=1263636 RepID=UPI001FE6BC55|nr:histidine kinase [Microbacterium kyungheense]